jgi:hypothetical protein
MRTYFLLFPFILVVFVFCENSQNEMKATVDTDSFTTVYTNYLRATVSDTTTNMNTNALFDSILEQSFVSMEEFKKSLFYLRSHPAKFEEVLTAIIDSLEQVEIENPKKKN